MFKKIIPALFIISLFVSCKTKNAFKFSQDFVTKEKSLIPSLEMTESKVEAFVKEKKFDSVVAVSGRMEKMIEDIIAPIKAAPAPDAEDGEKFKVDVIKYFEHMKSIYTSYKAYGNATNDEARDAELLKLQEIAAKNSEVTTIIQTSQKSFAKANGFKIEDK
jgi:hypothetical protein